MALTVVSWNINGVGARLSQVTRYLEERSPDVLCLQDAWDRPSDHLPVRATFDMPAY